jgi:dGTPase
MEWPQLLNYNRLGVGSGEEFNHERTPWEIDADRIIFSSPFRRLQDKTQVVPLASSDYVRTRLTHSLEVASVGRTLGNKVGARVIKRHKLTGELSDPSNFGSIVGAACLGHDVGNPPFGHGGEDAFRHFFQKHPFGQNLCSKMDAGDAEDLRCFEGNAHGFRIMGRQQMYRNAGGMRLTYSTLAAFTKYPTEASAVCDDKAHPERKKPGFFQQDAELFEEVANAVGLPRAPKGKNWARHPLAYLVEAADDICYRIVDFEDAFRLKALSWDEVYPPLRAIADDPNLEERLGPPTNRTAIMAHLRAIAIGKLMEKAAAVYEANEDQILSGLFGSDLVGLIEEYKDPLKTIKELSGAKFYGAPGIISTELAGFEIICGLLASITQATEAASEAYPGKSDPKSRRILQLLPRECFETDGSIGTNVYNRTLRVVEFVAGMTDTYALRTYRHLQGVAMPEGIY